MVIFTLIDKHHDRVWHLPSWVELSYLNLAPDQPEPQQRPYHTSWMTASLLNEPNTQVRGKRKDSPHTHCGTPPAMQWMNRCSINNLISSSLARVLCCGVSVLVQQTILIYVCSSLTYCVWKKGWQIFLKAGKSQVWLITLIMASIYFAVSISNAGMPVRTIPETLHWRS